MATLKPRILFLDHTGVLGGAELFLLELAARWDGERQVVLFGDGPFRERLERAAVPVSVFRAGEKVASVGRGGRGLAQLLAVPDLFKLAWRVARHATKFDLLFANSQKALVVGAIASRIAGKPLVWYLHDILTADHFSALNRWVSVNVGSRCAIRVIANSEASRRAFVMSGGRAKRTAVVYNGIDSKPFVGESVEKAAQQLRLEMGWGAGPVVGVFSRLAPWKGQHVLLEALPLVPNLRAVVVGAPLIGDEEHYLEELEARARELGVSERVRFMGFREDIPALLHAMDFVAHTSVSPEPFGRVIVEGMLAGKPVLATRAGGACEIIEDGVTGCLVPPGDAAELSRALRSLIEQPAMAERLGLAAREFAARQFSVDAMLDGLRREIRLAMPGE